MERELIFIGGFFHFGFVIFHLFFWKIFKWKKDLKSLLPVNRAVMQIMNICLIFIFFIIGSISLFHVDELLTESLGRVFLISVSGFWFLRLILQFVYFGIRRTLSIILSVLFLLGSIIYIIPVI